MYYNTITPLLRTVLADLMEVKIFDPFRLVGGTALSLYCGHRMSIDIDLFTDAEYDTIDFEAIDFHLREHYPYVDTNTNNIIGMGKSYYVGENEDNCIKLDLFYTDKFIDDFVSIDNIRLATIEEIIAMKLDVIQRNGRKKDFWDIHELSARYTLNLMLDLHEKRYPYTHNRALLLTQFKNFTEADDDFEPNCLRGKHWELIKMDILELLDNF